MAQPNLTPANIGIRARERVDMVNSSFISATEESNYIESAWKELYLDLVAKHEDIFLNRKTLTTIANNEALDLNELQPFSFTKLRGVQYFDNSKPGNFLGKIDVREEMLVSSGRTGRPTFYSVHSPTLGEPRLILYPTPDRVYSLRAHYIPIRSLQDWIGSTGRLSFLGGLSEILEVSVAIKMRDKEEGDCSVLMAEKARLYELLSKAMTPFDEGEPSAVVQRTPRFSIYDDPFDLEEHLGD